MTSEVAGPRLLNQAPRLHPRHFGCLTFADKVYNGGHIPAIFYDYA